MSDRTQVYLDQMKARLEYFKYKRADLDQKIKSLEWEISVLEYPKISVKEVLKLMLFLDN